MEQVGFVCIRKKYVKRKTFESYRCCEFILFYVWREINKLICYLKL